MKKQNQKNLEFLKSSFSPNGQTGSIEDILKWLKKRKQHVSLKIEKSLFSKLENWTYDEKLGIVKHESWKFFTIERIKVATLATFYDDKTLSLRKRSLYATIFYYLSQT